MGNINFGIDLGTTNSGIGKYENGRVQVIKNPVGLREILPSVVSFYRGRTLVGEKAREQYLSNAGSVFSAFKRKMGTGETYPVSQQGQENTLTPVDLSAHVLKELKNYIPGTDIGAAVITIPASFDTIQSNATKQAGYLAGFKEVVLLQEPIAACLAYANLSHLNIDKEQKWLVYDFGGGTFDAALVYINQRELKIIDNKGNNFLGGVDIDHAYIKQVIVPRLAKVTGDTDLWSKLTQKQGVYDKLWHYLNYLAEEAKKQLSVTEETWMEIDFPELDLFLELTLTRAEFNDVVQPIYQESERFLFNLLNENQLLFKDIERVIMVGGTTYIPFVKDALRQTTGAVVDDSIDPTTAIIVGAAYYAGAHSLAAEAGTQEDAADKITTLDLKLSFEAYTNDLEELVAFKTDVPFTGFYRVTRTDGGFDSGMIGFSDTASEFVTLLPKTKNSFRLTVFDLRSRPVFDAATIGISHGLYSVSGQLLPEDICIELDGKEQETYLEAIFKRNNILPLKRTLYKTFSKSIIKGTDDKLIINVVEGKSGTLPGANISIGYIELSGKEIDQDLIQGTDIELQLEMDESRGLKVELFIPSSGQQLTKSFHITQREVNIAKMLTDIAAAECDITREIVNSDAEEAYELSAMFKKIGDELQSLKAQMKAVAQDKATEEKYRLDEKKRQALGELDSLTRSRDVFIAISNYQAERQRFMEQESDATERQKHTMEQIIAGEKERLLSNDKHQVERVTEEMKKLNNEVWLQKDENYIRLFLHLSSCPDHMFKPEFKREELIATGHIALQAKDYVQLRQVVGVLFNYLKDEYKNLPDKKVEHASNIRTMKTGLK